MYNLPIINNTTNKINSKQFSPIKQRTTKIKFMSKGGKVNYSSYAPMAKLDYYTISNNSVINIKREFRYEYANTYTNVSVPYNTYLSMEIPYADVVSITYSDNIETKGSFNRFEIGRYYGSSLSIPNSKNVNISNFTINNIYFPDINQNYSLNQTLIFLDTYKVFY